VYLLKVMGAVAGEQEKLAGEDCSFPPIAQSPQRASALVGDPDGAMNGAPTSFVAGRDNRQQQKRMRGFFASELSVENLSGCGYSAGDVDGAVFFLVFFGRWVGEKPGLLVLDEAGGFFADVADGFEGEFAGDAVGSVVGRGLQIGGPALGGVEELGKRLADVAVVGAVVVEIVVELVGDGGELLEEVVSVLLAAGFAGVGEELLNGFVAVVEEFDEDQDTVVGDIGGGAKLLDFGFGEDGIAALGVQRQGESAQEERVGEATEHAVLVAEDLGEELVVNLIESFEGRLQGGAVFAGGLVEILAEAIGGVVHELLGVLEALGVFGEVKVDEGRVVLNFFQGRAGLVDVAIEHLFACDLGH
jgi:hypothetical protein